MNIDNDRVFYIKSTPFFIFLFVILMQVLFDEIREMTRGNLLVPLQALVRGFVTRSRVAPLLAKVRVSPQQRALWRAQVYCCSIIHFLYCIRVSVCTLYHVVHVVCVLG